MLRGNDGQGRQLLAEMLQKDYSGMAAVGFSSKTTHDPVPGHNRPSRRSVLHQRHLNLQGTARGITEASHINCYDFVVNGPHHEPLDIRQRGVNRKDIGRRRRARMWLETCIIPLR